MKEIENNNDKLNKALDFIEKTFGDENLDIKLIREANSLTKRITKLVECYIHNSNKEGIEELTFLYQQFSKKLDKFTKEKEKDGTVRK